MSVAFRKVWRDLWNNKGRTLLVVLSIGVGVLAVGMITASNSFLARQMTNSQRASQPSHVTLFLRGQIDDETVTSLSRLPEVAEGEGFIGAGIRWKPTLDADWQQASLIARADYERQTFDLVELRSGQWPKLDAVAVEFNHLTPYNVPTIGGTIYFEVNNRAKALQLGGILRDPGQFPPPFTDRPTFYVTRDMLERLGFSRDFSQFRFTIPEYTKEQAKVAADVVETRLKKLGVSVASVLMQEPERHFLQDIMDGVGLILAVMAVMSLGLSTILVVNTINAVIAQQVPQIGIMKTVGGISSQIETLYLVGVAVYGGLSLAVAVPLGALGANLLAQWMLGLINVPAASFEVLRSSLLYQIGAGLLSPLLAALWPVLQGVAISVREAISAYGLGTGRYGSGWLDKILGRFQGLPRMAALALRNTFRRAGRVALTQITLIAAGAVFMMVVSASYSFSATIAGIWEGFGFDVLIGFEQFQRIDEIVPLIESRPNVESAEMWIWQTAKAKAVGVEGAGDTYEVFLRGIPVNSEMFKPKLTAGRGLDPADGHAVLLNQKLAQDMALKVGDTIVIDLGAAQESKWTIVGLVFDITGNQQTAYLNRELLGAELNLAGRATVAEIRAKVNTPSSQAQTEKDLEKFFKARGINLSFTTSASKDREQSEAQFNILTTLLLIMTFLIAIVGSMGLSGTLSINVLERRREIGVMRAVGASSIDVGLIFTGEGLLLGLVSWALAVPLSTLAGRYFVEAVGEVIKFPVIYYYSANSVWIWLGIVTLLSLLASWLPARRATQISVRESLAYE